MQEVNFRPVDFSRRIRGRDGAALGRKLRQIAREFSRKFPDANEEFDRILQEARAISAPPPPIAIPRPAPKPAPATYSTVTDGEPFDEFRAHPDMYQGMSTPEIENALRRFSALDDKSRREILLLAGKTKQAVIKRVKKETPKETPNV